MEIKGSHKTSSNTCFGLEEKVELCQNYEGQKIRGGFLLRNMTREFVIVCFLFGSCLWVISGGSDISQFPSHSSWPDCREQGGGTDVSPNLSACFQCTERKWNPDWEPEEDETKLWKQMVKSAVPWTVSHIYIVIYITVSVGFVNICMYTYMYM